MTLTLLDMTLSIAVVAITAALIARAQSTDARIARRAHALSEELRAEHTMQAPPRSFVERMSARFATLGERLPIFEAAHRTDLAKRLMRAGLRSSRAVSVLIGVKVVVGLFAAAAAFFGGAHVPLAEHWLVLRIVMGAAALMIGMMLPEFAVQAYARRRKRRIATALPDALDLLVICTNAGHSLAASIVRIAEEMRGIAPALAQELDITAQELRLDGDSVTVLRNLAERVDVPSLRTLATTLAQSQRYGTPVTQALQVLARAERNEAMHLLEERAAKLSIKITLPMMLFILPTVILIAAGPAALRLMSVFK
jgi:tight adherence protein C